MRARVLAAIALASLLAGPAVFESVRADPIWDFIVTYEVLPSGGTSFTMLGAVTQTMNCASGWLQSDSASSAGSGTEIFRVYGSYALGTVRVERQADWQTHTTTFTCGTPTTLQPAVSGVGIAATGTWETLCNVLPDQMAPLAGSYMCNTFVARAKQQVILDPAQAGDLASGKIPFSGTMKFTLFEHDCRYCYTTGMFVAGLLPMGGAGATGPIRPDSEGWNRYGGTFSVQPSTAPTSAASWSYGTWAGRFVGCNGC